MGMCIAWGKTMMHTGFEKCWIKHIKQVSLQQDLLKTIIQK